MKTHSLFILVSALALGSNSLAVPAINPTKTVRDLDVDVLVIRDEPQPFEIPVKSLDGNPGLKNPRGPMRNANTPIDPERQFRRAQVTVTVVVPRQALPSGSAVIENPIIVARHLPTVTERSNQEEEARKGEHPGNGDVNFPRNAKAQTANVAKTAGAGVAAGTGAAVEKGIAAEKGAAAQKVAAAGVTGATGAATGGVLPDGRIAQAAVATDFNVVTSAFKSAVVKGDGLVFSDIVSFPTVEQSLFDIAGNTKAFEIVIDDKSIFIPEGQAAQDTIRRADLLPSIASTLDDIATTGVKTMHFSLQADAAKPLDLTHDYQVMFLESKDFTLHQFDVRVGTVVGAAAGSAGAAGTNIVVNGNSLTAGGAPELFSAPFDGVAGFQNFAITMDFDANTIQVFHSVGNEPLAKVTEPVANDMTGNGEYHFGIVKNPKGAEAQASIVGAEGITWGGIFMEDSAGGIITLQ